MKIRAYGSKALLKTADNEHKEILILGDFNCNALDKSKYRFLRQVVSQYQLKQLINNATQRNTTRLGNFN
jgi:endonuclease/exonuclease/phosphatase family metal-dependent hydrolase